MIWGLWLPCCKHNPWGFLRARVQDILISMSQTTQPFSIRKALSAANAEGFGNVSFDLFAYPVTTSHSEEWIPPCPIKTHQR